MKAIAAALLLAFATPALAGACDDGLKKIDAAVAEPSTPPDVKAQVQDMAAQARQLCDAGNEDEGSDIISEAIALLGIE
jgi:hypothetical protein